MGWNWQSQDNEATHWTGRQESLYRHQSSHLRYHEELHAEPAPPADVPRYPKHPGKPRSWCPVCRADRDSDGLCEKCLRVMQQRAADCLPLADYRVEN